MISRRSLLTGAATTALVAPAEAMPPATMRLLLGPSLGPSLDLNFLTGLVDPRINFTRASGAAYYDATGTLQTAGNNAPRIGYGPTGGATPLGLLIEEQRTNSIRNNTMAGAVAGTPGTLPTNWSLINFAAVGFTTTVVGSGTESGVPYLDVNISGTANAATVCAIFFESNTTVAAASGQTWTLSCYTRLIGGTAPSGLQLSLKGRTSGGGSNEEGPTAVSPTGAQLITQRNTSTYTFASGTTVFASGAVQLVPVPGNTYNFTLRIGAPQLELGAFATSPILTTGAAATRAAELASITSPTLFRSLAGVSMAATAVPLNVTATTPGNTGNQRYLDLNDGTSLNTATIIYSDSGNYSYASAATAGAAQANALTLVPAIVNQTVKVAAAFTSGAYTCRSSTGATAASGTQTGQAVPLGAFTTLSIGNRPAQDRAFTGWFQGVRFWPRILSSTELTQVTT